MSKKIIIGNWKLNPITVDEAKTLASKVKHGSQHTVVLCPPTAFLSSVRYPNLGAQDAFWINKGPHTGETSPLQLKSLGISYCIVGHSERRTLGETNEMIREKILAVLNAKMTPVLCVGFGTTMEEDDLEVIDVLRTQLTECLRDVPTGRVIVAYEPVWAISSGNPYATKKMATPEHAEKIAIFIKTKFNIPKVLYGGSITSVNSKEFLDQEHLDGLLVGGASLLPDDFNKIIA